MAGWKAVYRTLRKQGIGPLSAFFLAWDIRRTVPEDLQSALLLSPMNKTVRVSTLLATAELQEIIKRLKVEQRLDKLLGRRWQRVYGLDQTAFLIALDLAAAEESGRHDLLDEAMHPGNLEHLAVSGRRVRGLVEGICRQADPDYQLSDELKRRFPVLDPERA